MNTYFSTFITGFDYVIKNVLNKKLKNIKIKLLLDGLVVYNSKFLPDEIKKIRFFNNSFILFKLFKAVKQGSIDWMIRQVLNDRKIKKAISNYAPQKSRSFRIITAKENQTISVNKSLVRKLEKIISQVKSFTLNRSKPDVEFWFLARREGCGFFGMRFTNNPDQEKYLEKGELRPELANILCLISEPNPRDIFLDPFCGSGAIPIERAIVFPFKQILVGDNNLEIINKLKSKIRKTKNKRISKKKFIISHLDALNLKSICNEAVNKIVTDPPWGLYSGKDLDFNIFYFAILKEFYRVLKINGLLVILVAKKELFENILSSFSSKLKLLEKYTTLVSGQKISVYKIKKEA